jgi:hypothetical protein
MTDSNQGEARRKRAVALLVTPTSPDAAPFTITVSGRVLWALQRLIEAGKAGCPPITQPAPRWAAYVHTLRGLGVPIETIQEDHGGDFPGTHGKYILRANIIPASKGGASDGQLV